MKPFRAVADFFFAPRATGWLAALRFLVGLEVFFWALSLFPQRAIWLGRPGILSAQTAERWITVFCRECLDPANALPVAWQQADIYSGCLILLPIAGLAFALGLFTYVSGWIALILMQAFMVRGIFAMYGGDFLLKTLLFYLLLSPCGRIYSLDVIRSPQTCVRYAAPWALRLFQIQIALVYIATFFYKCLTPNWQHGNAVYYSTRLEHYNRNPLPLDWLTSTEGNFITWAILGLELALGTVIWWRPLRPWVLLSGIALHLGMETSMSIPFWQITMMIGLLSFADTTVVTTAKIQLCELGKILVKKSDLRDLRAAGWP